MSVEIMTVVINSAVEPAMTRYVLLMVANNANADGVCWPSIDTIARNTRLSERTVQRCLRDLEEVGILSKMHRIGRSSVIQINVKKIPAEEPRPPLAAHGLARSSHPSHTDTPVTQSPLSDRHPRQSDRGDSATRVTDSPNRGDTQSNRGVTQTPRTVKNPKGTVTPSLRSGSATPKGTRLPDDWQPDASLKTWARENCPALLDTPGAGTIETEKFRDYWRGVAGAKGRKLDWPATWRNWMRKANDDATNQHGGRPARLGRAQDDPAYWDRVMARAAAGDAADMGTPAHHSNVIEGTTA